ncbi:hypothetical protein UGMREWDR_CDS0082 [Aeromonas phage GomatiRiver_11]|nr:hypothetical protein OBDJBBDK_00076 [Aeromonas phage AhFM11]WKW84249.1 hypothetical protein UGMREWDR_CDS0082 [Aeromonas phage GomatiRiver_11]
MGIPNYRLLLCEERSHGVEKELYDLFIEMNSIGTNNQDTWGKLFKTKNYNASQVAMAEYKEKIRKIIAKNFPQSTMYAYELIGRKGIVDVSMKRGQRILVKLSYGDEQ